MTRIVRHNLTTGFLLGAVGVPLALILSAPQLGGLAERERAQNEAAKPYRQVREEINQDLLQRKQGSRIPMDLVNANGCTPVTLRDDPSIQADFFENTPVVPRTEDGQVIPPGEYVCTRKGQSAQVGMNSRLINIQSVGINQREEYQESFDKLRELRGLE